MCWSGTIRFGYVRIGLRRRIFRDVFDTLIGFLSSPQATASLIAAGGTHREFMDRLAELMHDER